MSGQSSQDPHADLDDVQVGDDDLAIIDEIDGGDSGGSGDDDDLAVLAEKFSGDPKELARSYANLQRKFGEQGREVGELRGELRAAMQMMAARATDGGDGAATDPGEEFLADLESQVSSGTINLVDAFRKMMDLTKNGGASSGQATGTLSSEEKNEVWEDFADANPMARKLEPLMSKIISEQSHLIRLDKGPRVLRKGLKSILEIAVSRYNKAQANRGGNRRGGRMDSGQSRRVRRPSGGASRSGENRFSDEQFNEAIDGARQSGKTRDWATPVGMILDTLEGFEPDGD
jgi:hypothetical protein